MPLPLAGIRPKSAAASPTSPSPSVSSPSSVLEAGSSLYSPRFQELITFSAYKQLRSNLQ